MEKRTETLLMEMAVAAGVGALAGRYLGKGRRPGNRMLVWGALFGAAPLALSVVTGKSGTRVGYDPFEHRFHDHDHPFDHFDQHQHFDHFGQHFDHFDHDHHEHEHFGRF